MSTVGKVLVVLVTLVVIVWIILISGITEVNKNYAKAIKDERGKIEKLEPTVLAEQQRTVLNRDETNNQQVATGEAVAILQARQAMLEKRRSAALDDTSRARFLREKSEGSEKGAVLDNETRLKELDAMKKALAEEEALVKKLQGENDELMAHLTKLREEFRALLRANQDDVKALAKKVSQ